MCLLFFFFLDFLRCFFGRLPWCVGDDEFEYELSLLDDFDLSLTDLLALWESASSFELLSFELELSSLSYSLFASCNLSGYVHCPSVIVKSVPVAVMLPPVIVLFDCVHPMAVPLQVAEAELRLASSI